jgi:hypothetical protein
MACTFLQNRLQVLVDPTPILSNPSYFAPIGLTFNSNIVDYFPEPNL